MTDTRRIPVRTLLSGLLTLFCALLWLRSPSLAASAVGRGIALVINTLLPSLFPFAVLSELLRSSPVTARLLSRLSRPIARLLHVGEAGATALLLGLLCGAPVGAQGLSRALEEGTCTPEECERLLGAATVPSAAFLIGAVGEGLFSSPALGVLLLAAVLLSSLLFACGMRGGAVPPLPPPRARVHGHGIARTFTDAVRTGARTMLTVASLVVFFCVLSDTLDLVLSPLPEGIRTLAAALLELSDGAAHAAALPQKMPAASLTAFAAGWSGLCVHCQVLSVCEGHGLTLRKYFLCKAGMGLLSALLVLSFLWLLPDQTSMSFM